MQRSWVRSKPKTDGGRGIGMEPGFVRSRWWPGGIRIPEKAAAVVAAGKTKRRASQWMEGM